MSIYKKYGVKPIINASGTVTRLGGAPMPPQVLQAYQDAARESVSLEEMQATASRHIAKLTGTDAALVTSGCAAALTLGTAACLTSLDLGRMERLPDCTGFPNEFVIGREQRSGYDHAIRAAGAKLVEVGFNEIVSNAGVRRTAVWEYEAAFGPSTAGVVYAYGPNTAPPVTDVVAVAHRHGLPVIVDAAGELPPREHLTSIPATGADLVAFSGGKAMRGPQSTGILCGRRDLITAAALQMLDMDDHYEMWNPPTDFIDKQKLPGIPRHGIGRGFKVSKESIVALLTALDLFVSGTYDEELLRYRAMLGQIANGLANAPVRCNIVESSDGERWPVLEVEIDEMKLGCTAVEVCRRLREGDPPIYVGHGKLREGRLVVNPVCLADGDVEVLEQRLFAELLGS